MDRASYQAHLLRLEEEERALRVQLQWLYRIAAVIAVACLPGAFLTLWIPAGGLFFAVFLAGTAYYIGTVHLQSTQERLSDLRNALNKESSS